MSRRYLSQKITATVIEDYIAEREHGEQAALVARALASLIYSISATDAIHDELLRAGVPIGAAVESNRAVWTDTRDRITHASLAPLLVDLDADRAAELSSKLCRVQQPAKFRSSAAGMPIPFRRRGVR